MKRVKIIFILICLGNFCFAQNSTNLINHSIELIGQNNESDFDKTYPSIYSEYVKENIPYYNNAIEYIRNHDERNAINSIDSIIQSGLLLDEILADQNFTTLLATKEGKMISQKICDIKSKYNNEVRICLQQLKNKDQSIRLILLSAQKNNSQDSALIKKIKEKMKQIDVATAKEITKIIDKHGWQGENEIGEEANEMLFLGLQHADDLIVQTKYLPILEKAVKNGNAQPWHLAFLTDRILMNQGKKQIYGTQVIISKNPANSYVVPLKNPDNVDKLRKEIGLEPLKEYLMEHDMEWNLEEYKKQLPKIEELYKKRSAKK